MLGKFGDKQPYEEYYLKFDFTEELAESDSIDEITATVIQVSDDSDTSPTMLDPTKDYADGSNAYVWIKGGTTDTVYLVTCKVTTSVLKEKYELEGSITVREIP